MIYLRIVNTIENRSWQKWSVFDILQKNKKYYVIISELPIEIIR